MERGGYIYIMSNKNKTTFYIGVTSDLYSRVREHKSGIYKGFTKRYNCNELVYYEFLETIDLAIKREKQLKKWSRQNKINLILSANPKMDDLFLTL